MRCYICDAGLKEPIFNADHQDYEPCPHCLMVVNDTVGSFGIKPFAEEDDFGDDDLGGLPTSYRMSYDFT